MAGRFGDVFGDPLEAQPSGPGYEPMTPEGRAGTGMLAGSSPGTGMFKGSSPGGPAPFASPFAEEPRQYVGRIGGGSGVGGQIVQELVKSYGFRRDEQTGDWSWSLGNVVTSFKEDPFWTTLDYLTLAVPVAKWGTAARAVAKGGEAAGVIGKAFRAGEFAGRAPTSWAGRAAGLFTGSERAAAAEAALKYRSGPGRVARGLNALTGEKEWGTRLSRFVSNPITKQVDDEYISWAKEFGANSWEMRGIGDAMAKDLMVEDAYVKRMVGETVRDISRAGLDDEQGTRFYKLLGDGASPEQAEAAIRSWGLTERRAKAAQRAWRATFDFRNQLHIDSWEMNLISDETFWRNVPEGLGDEVVSYMPQLKGEYQRLRQLGIPVPAAAAGARKAARAAGKAEGLASFQHRLPPDEVKALTALMDPTQGIERLGKAAHVVARQRYARRMLDSAVARPAEDVVGVVKRFMDLGDPAILKAAGVPAKAADKLGAGLPEMLAVEKYDAEEIARLAGWMSAEDLFPKGIPGYLQRIDDDMVAAGGRGLKEIFIDPMVAKDIQAQFGFMEKMPDTLEKWWGSTLAYFKASKTAYNPATHFRNWFGAATFHYLTTGGTPKMLPAKGLRSILALDEKFKLAAKAGIVGGTFDQEIRKALETAGVHLGDEFSATALDFLGNSKVMKLLQKGAGKAEGFYRMTDEMWKLDAFIERFATHEKILKQQLGVAGALTDDLVEKVVGSAAQDVNKFMPTFITHSPLGGKASQLMPFSSFTFEALRVWKNGLIDNPHRVFFMNHIVESMSAAATAVAGANHAEVQAAEQALPYHMRGKKALALPWRSDDGKLQFVDMSYMIPLANMVEGQQGGSLFFDEMFNVTAHPLVSFAAAAATNTDPFTDRELAPDFTERQLGVPVTSEKGRRAVGLFEHTLKSLAPPIIPPGYVGTNLMELARGQRHADTGQLLEEDAFRTIIGNFGGFRAYEAGIENELINVRKETRDAGARVSEAWNRWEWAAANGKLGEMAREEKRIISMKNLAGEDGAEYFRHGLKNHRPGSYANYSRKQLAEVLDRSRLTPGDTASKRDREIYAELMARAQGGRKDKGFGF